MVEPSRGEKRAAIGPRDMRRQICHIFSRGTDIAFPDNAK
jgi:hypothetical protein